VRRTSRRLAVLLPALALAACAGSGAASPAAKGKVPGVAAGEWASFAAERAAVVEAAGLAPLSGGGEEGREVRVFTGLDIGYPRTLYRIRAVPGGAEGEVWLYWHESPADAPLRDAWIEMRVPGGLGASLVRDGRCGEVRRAGALGLCRRRLRAEPAWAALLAEAERVAALRGTDASKSADESGFARGWRMSVAAFDGDRVREPEFSAPGFDHDPAALAAAALAERLEAVDTLLAPAVPLPIHRGRYDSGPGRSEFRPCGAGGGRAWELRGRVFPASKWTELAAGARPATADSAYVEVRGALADRATVAAAGSAYRDVLEADTVRRLAPWTPSACG
jgi:hypothetical protein